MAEQSPDDDPRQQPPWRLLASRPSLDRMMVLLAGVAVLAGAALVPVIRDATRSPAGASDVEAGSAAASEGPAATPGDAAREPTITPTPTPTEEPPTSAPPPPSPDAMPVGDLPGWRQVFTDDFTSPVALGSFTASTYGARWFAYRDYPDTSGRGWYSPDQVLSVSDGALDWSIHTDQGTPRVAAVVPHVPGSWGWPYGRYSFRFRADTIPGYKLVGILWPDSDNWGEGEIDFPEVNQLTSDQPIYANLFPPGDTATRQPGAPSRIETGVPANDSGWHIATIEWLPGSVTTWLDGTELGTFTQGVPSTPMHLVIQVETNLHGFDPDPSTAGHIQVDWMTMYVRK